MWYLNNLKGVSGSGATYTRWGRTSCPNVTGTELVYAGRAGGTFYNTPGGAANKLCLPEDPDYLIETAGFGGLSQIYGAEYRFSRNLHDLGAHNVPCAVCYVSTRTSVLMIPAKTQCPSSWTREYNGYLTAKFNMMVTIAHHLNVLIVVQNSFLAAAVMLMVHSSITLEVYNCNGLACPPYESNRILSCTVCTK